MFVVRGRVIFKGTFSKQLRRYGIILRYFAELWVIFRRKLANHRKTEMFHNLWNYGHTLIEIAEIWP